MMPNNDLRYVGALQDFGEPFVALYVDLSKRRLYLMVRVNAESDDMDYAVTEVDVKEVEAYMKETMSLSSLLRGKEFWMAVFANQHLRIYKDDIPDLEESIDDVDDFNPEYCDDEFWIETFLKRMKKNMPLEIAKRS